VSSEALQSSTVLRVVEKNLKLFKTFQRFLKPFPNAPMPYLATPLKNEFLSEAHDYSTGFLAIASVIKII
jgi:hypothetical protein